MTGMDMRELEIRSIQVAEVPGVTFQAANAPDRNRISEFQHLPNFQLPHVHARHVTSAYVPVYAAKCPVTPLHGPAECAERLNPPPLPYGKSWRVKSKAQVHILRSHLADLRPPHISPSGPVHSAGPPQNDRPTDFVIFKKH